MPQIRIDAGGRTFLPICACGWRGLPQDDRGAARLAGRHHEQRAHPGDKQALRALNNQRARDRQRG